MKNIESLKSGYTLAELLIAVALLIVVTGLTIPVAKKILPESDKEKVKFTYYQLNSIIKSMTTDPYLYPTGRFDNPRKYSNQQTGVTYERDEKFSKAFASKLNVLKIKILGGSTRWNGTAENNSATKKWNDIVGYADKDMNTPRGISRGGDPVYYRTCILTNNKIYYCVPTFTFESTNTETASGENTDRFFENGSVIVKVYFGEDHDITKGYYFTVNKEGKISILKEEFVTCLGENNSCINGKNCTPQSDCACGKENIYKKYNHCKLYEYLSHTKN